MARFLFPLRPAARVPRQRASHAVETRRAVSSNDAGRGPGWYDSSLELRRGLEVREGIPDDLHLELWLDAFCGGGRRGEPVLATA